MSQRLAVYGTLAPGCPNHHELERLGGRWFEGRVRGHLREEGWGSDMGFPGITLDPDGPEVTVHVLESDLLADEWMRLDEFEGPSYQRTLVSVTTDDGVVDASIYALAPT